ncbi:Vacuolar protein sorting-associated protein vps17 [Taphrina deformans PYCC 5710]|uniref:Vacuolar protein sorting-associated protein 17 n=1 Tax=Taphrina deformans (strain PYCC 5710 / ATCC 11124 / CBS 356.35 / IMI 108563 / JCM 9778 / NBRC 8474) TaxID=1097556 RepID=R4XAY5_TAPDE|nr:Vacuolar protein sorting-associated protein vps17 [Taphrina deformans PYCC 5710]|eukprot:CCG82729.1 Vacuolar protein sorting-associated protein vps17 [Taphrina deformans PYCC 5710]
MTEQYFLKTNITALERAKKDPIVRFDAQTNLPGFRTTQFRDTRRTHHEFEKLADHLVNNNPECMVPALFPSSTSYGSGTDEDERKVKNNMQHWLNLVCNNIVLIRDPEIVHFIESDFGWSPVNSSGKPATGIKRRAIKQLQPPPDDSVELAEARPVVKQFHLLTAESESRLHRVVKSRTGLALAEQDFGKKLGALSEGETHTGLANALGKLGRILQAVSDAHSAHATHEAATLGDALAYHSRDAFVAKETLTTRQFLIRELNQAQNSSRTKQANASRLKSSSSIQSTKVDEALSLLEEAKATEQQLSSKLTRVTSNLLLENRAWKLRTAKELKSAIADFVRKQVESERRILATLESVRPDVRAIDASGGLSRLGRTNLQRTGSHSGPSQTTAGDAWSGLKRVTPPTSALINSNLGTRARSGSNLSVAVTKSVPEDGSDRVNARNAASILANGF